MLLKSILQFAENDMFHKKIFYKPKITHSLQQTVSDQ